MMEVVELLSIYVFIIWCGLVYFTGHCELYKNCLYIEFWIINHVTCTSNMKYHYGNTKLYKGQKKLSKWEFICLKVRLK